jgi:hypothetical protein
MTTRCNGNMVTPTLASIVREVFFTIFIYSLHCSSLGVREANYGSIVYIVIIIIIVVTFPSLGRGQ